MANQCSRQEKRITGVFPVIVKSKLTFKMFSMTFQLALVWPAYSGEWFSPLGLAKAAGQLDSLRVCEF
jgi:hypothetical protein